MVVIVLPIHNEEQVLEQNVKKLHQFLLTHLFQPWQVVLASNGSTDASDKIGAYLAASLSNLTFMSLKEAGKGLAIRKAWQSHQADYYLFMDGDLATDLEALPRLVSALDQGAEVVYGSRFEKKSKVSRPWLRKVFSKIYGQMFRWLLKSNIQDPACGFKGVRANLVQEIMPQVASQSWFFDSELILRAEKAGFKLCPLAIDWSEYLNPGRKSTVPFTLIFTYLREILRLRKSLQI